MWAWKDFLGKSMRHGTAPEGKEVSRPTGENAIPRFLINRNRYNIFRPKDQRPADRFSPETGAAQKAALPAGAGRKPEERPVMAFPRLRAQLHVLMAGSPVFPAVRRASRSL